ncbi:hypothetical protein AW736_00200 [Termitidicoccus mucosus]|uniref:Uncharacterized protein n=1 Tax=Termitidicoccus mucosus TaxID=1184151 RepID=A0A178IP88_9BACT|nr:hypothetical protein AW736_00200 [Opitutaceae bacterium TSB47]
MFPPSGAPFGLHPWLRALPSRLDKIIVVSVVNEFPSPEMNNRIQFNAQQDAARRGVRPVASVSTD